MLGFGGLKARVSTQESPSPGLSARWSVSALNGIWYHVIRCWNNWSVITAFFLTLMSTSPQFSVQHDYQSLYQVIIFAYPCCSIMVILVSEPVFPQMLNYDVLWPPENDILEVKVRHKWPSTPRRVEIWLKAISGTSYQSNFIALVADKLYSSYMILNTGEINKF